MGYNFHPQFDINSLEVLPLLEEPPQGYGLGLLKSSGDKARVYANPLPTVMILGTRATDLGSVIRSKRIVLQATPNQGGIEWILSSIERPDAPIKLPPGQIYPVGRLNFDLFPKDEPYTREYVSREHLSILALGNQVEIVQLGNKNQTYIMAPQGSFQIAQTPDETANIQPETQNPM